jgi:gliding motility-associated lipoprotein GldD
MKLPDLFNGTLHFLITMTKKRVLWIFTAGAILLAVFFFWQSSDLHMPKPRGYFRIELPEKIYRSYQPQCPLSIEIPQYAKVEVFREHNSLDSCWFNIYFPKLNARLHCTYIPVGDNISNLLRDSYGFAAKHEMKASALKRTMVNDTAKHVYGIVYDIEGDAASQLQFFLTDSTDHFLRGSLYFFNSPNPDSVQPVLSFIREDVMHITRSIQWE